MDKIELMNSEEVAELLQITPSALRNKIWRGADYPPYIKLKGQKRKTWLRETVYQWLKNHETR